MGAPHTRPCPWKLLLLCLLVLASVADLDANPRRPKRHRPLMQDGHRQRTRAFYRRRLLKAERTRQVHQYIVPRFEDR